MPSVNLLGGDDWIVVRKQKVTILIPPLPGAEQLITANTGESQPEMPRTTVDTAPPSPAAVSANHLASEREKSLLQAPECAIPVANIVCPQSRLSLPKSSSTGHLMTSENTKLQSVRCRTSNHGLSTLKVRRQALLFGGGMPLLNQRMRAINIEKKVREAGGLSCWLVSLGLERFVNIFQQERMNRFQLANLTMKKLKDMGAFAVGPRRKLIHALDCLCQPCCFEHV